MRISIVLIIWLIFPCLSVAEDIVERAAQDEVSLIPHDDPTMAKAMKLARDTLPTFLARYKNPHPGQASFAVKIGVRDRGEVEYFWVNQFVKTKDGAYSGVLNNEPRIVTNVKFGQQIAFAEDEIVDWTYIDNGKMKGNFCSVLTATLHQRWS